MAKKKSSLGKAASELKYLLLSLPFILMYSNTRNSSDIAQLLLNIDAEPADKMNLQALSFQDFMPGSAASSMSSQMEGSAIGLGTIGSSMLKPQACELVKVWVMDSHGLLLTFSLAAFPRHTTQ